jgi:hypothetical protein
MDFIGVLSLNHLNDLEQIKEYFRTNTIVLIISILAVYILMWAIISLHYYIKERIRQKRRLNAAKKMIGG